MTRALLSCVLCSALCGSVFANEPLEDKSSWPQWRGPNRDCKVEGPVWPDKFPAEMKPVWRKELPDSYSGPIVSPDRVFVTGTLDKKYEVVRALDRSTGEQLWNVQWEGAMSVPFFAASNGSWIRSTPAWDGERLYVGGIRGVMVCLNADNGKEIWRKDFVKEFNASMEKFGFVCSPVVKGDHLFVQCCAGLLKLDKKTGDVIWRAMAESGGMMGGAFSSPVVATVAGKEQLIAQSRTILAGIDMDSGKVLWSKPIPNSRGMNILTPTVVGDSVFTSSHSHQAWMFKVAAGAEPTQTWMNRSNAYMSSPVVVDGHIYMHLQNQRVTCIDAATGETKWMTSKRFGKYWSMVTQGSKILALDERGELLLINATPEKFDVLDRKKVSQQSTWAHLAVADDSIFIRELKAQAVYKW
jgi:outer membrane protein assembly factor BamB